MNLSSKLRTLSETQVVAKSIEFKGEKLDFFVKTLNAAEVEEIGERGQTFGKKAKRESVNFRSRMISKAIVDENGKPAIPLNQCLQLSNALSNKLFECVAEVNDFGNSDDDEEATVEEKPSPETSDSD